MPLLAAGSPSLLGSTLKSAGLTFRLLTSSDELQALAPAWQELLDTSDSPEPMRSPSWLLPWWRVYGAGRSLAVGLFYQQEQIVGLIPLCQRRVWHCPGIPFTRLEFLGSDDDQPDGVCSEYLGLIPRTGWEERVTEAFCQKIHQGAFGAWHELVLCNMDGSDPHTDRLAQAFHSLGYASDRQTTMEAPYVLLPGAWEDYLKHLGSSKRRYLNVAIRAFESWAGNDWRLERATTPESLSRGQAILHELHNHRWSEGDGIDGAFSRPRFAEFHADVMCRFLSEGRLELFWMTVRGTPIAACYQIRTNGKTYFYQSGRRLDVPANVRPGIVLTIQAIRQAIDQGQREYDFLGGLAQYKLQFTKETRPLVQLRIARPGLRESIRRGAEGLLGQARRFRNLFRPCQDSGPVNTH